MTRWKTLPIRSWRPRTYFRYIVVVVVVLLCSSSDGVMVHDRGDDCVFLLLRTGLFDINLFLFDGCWLLVQLFPTVGQFERIHYQILTFCVCYMTIDVSPLSTERYLADVSWIFALNIARIQQRACNRERLPQKRRRVGFVCDALQGMLYALNALLVVVLS